MVEVFKTDVKDGRQAMLLIRRIHETFEGYKANFDLEDCDRILRVKSITGAVDNGGVIDLLREMGCCAEVLPDSAGGSIFVLSIQH